jgi:hypothetical protein
VSLARSVAGAALVGGGRAVGRLQELLPALRGAPPDADQERVLRTVFDDALPLGSIRIVPALRGAGIFALSRRAVTLGTTIYLKGDRRNSLLVHEAVHVWQFSRRGMRYAADAVVAQAAGHGYDWRAAVAAGATRWSDLDVEGQAQYVQDLYECGSGFEDGHLVVGDGAYFRAWDAGAVRDHPGHRALAEDAVATLRARREGPHSSSDRAPLS